MGESTAFDGAKCALFLGTQIVTILRDVHPGLAYPGCWDLPGGGREKGETPLSCVIREAREEVGLDLRAAKMIWSRDFASPKGPQWFFCAQLPVACVDKIVFGEEGQRWMLMPPQAFLSHPKAIPHLQQRLHRALEEIDIGMLGGS